MTDAFSWHILEMKHYVSSGTVFDVLWQFKAVRTLDDNRIFTSIQTGWAGLNTPDPDNFIPFENLQEETVIGWVQGVLGSAEIAALESFAVNELNTKENPVEARGLPWEPEPPVDPCVGVFCAPGYSCVNGVCEPVGPGPK